MWKQWPATVLAENETKSMVGAHAMACLIWQYFMYFMSSKHFVADVTMLCE